VHVRRAERVEYLARNAGSACHPVTDDREDGQVRVDVDILDLPFLQLPLERMTHDRGGTLSLVLGNGAADGMLRAALRDEDHRDVLFTQRTEETVRGARHTDHAGAFEVYQGN